MLTVEMIGESNDEEFEDEPKLGSKDFSWTVAHYEKQLMEIKLVFAEPLAISSGGIDSIRVTFKDTSLIYDFTGKQVEEGTSIDS